MSALDHLFVYGTLRRDSGHDAHRFLAEGASYVAAGTVRGVLYRLGWHPGAVLSEDGDSWIRGELYKMHDAAQLLAVLDDYEGCGPADPEPHRFARVDAQVRLHDGGDATAWIYVFRASTEDALRIDSGDWVQATTSAKP